MSWKDFFFFQKGERIAIILLLILIILGIILKIGLDYKEKKVSSNIQYKDITNEFNAYLNNLDSDSTSYQNAINNTKEEDKINIEKAKSQKDTIKPKLNQIKNNYIKNKLYKGEFILLNSSDTSQWKKIPGIGSHFANKIVKYQKLLGGYALKNQLLEVYGMSNELFVKIKDFIKEDNNFRKLKINELSFKELLSHPYLNYNQVKRIMNIRKTKKITTIEDISIFDEFSKDDIHKLKQYIEL